MKKTIVYDIKLRRPACILLQAAFRATVTTQDISGMGDWLTYPTPDMSKYEVTEKDIKMLQEMHHDRAVQTKKI